MIVGYPSEGEKEFEELFSFVDSFKFDRLGVFTYSVEEGTTAFVLGDPIPTEEKERRQARIMESQRKIIEELNSKKIGSQLKVIIDKNESGNCIGRTSHDAPDIDTEVLFNSEEPAGSFVNVTVEDAREHDLYGSLAIGGPR